MTDTLIKKTLDTITRHSMVSNGQTVLVAVSGGPDSMALMHVMHELRERLDIMLIAAHFDHGLRPESASDARFVLEAAQILGLPTLDYRKELAGVPGNVQTIAREARYAFLDKAAAKFNNSRVATAHNMNDQAETYLMRDIRGSGSTGLKGIPPVRGVYVRPFIDVSRDEIMEYIEARGIEYLTDPTNLKPVYLRNRIRMELLPLVEKINPNAVETLARAADIARVEDEYLGIEAMAAYAGSAAESADGSVSLDSEKLRSMHPAVRRRVIRDAIGHVRGDLLGVTYTHTLDAERLVQEGGTGRRLDLPGGVCLETVYGKAVFSVPKEHSPYRRALNVPGRTVIPEAGVTIVAEYADGPAAGPAEACIDPERLTGPLIARSRMAGDRFRPAGMGGSVKLKEFFIDRKVPRRVRDTVPVIVSGNDIVWVAGFRADERFVAGNNARNPLRLFLES